MYMADQAFDPKKLYRYNRETNSYSIDLSIDYYRDVYNDWDFSPFRNRDLDKDLLEYLEECSHEIPFRSNLTLNFYLPKDIHDPDKEARSVSGLRNYFRYSQSRMTRRRRRHMKSFVLYVSFGICFLVLAYLMQNVVSTVLLLNILPEGLFIGGWVLFWEAFSIAFFKIREVGRAIKIYERLADSTINYVYRDREYLRQRS